MSTMHCCIPTEVVPSLPQADPGGWTLARGGGSRTWELGVVPSSPRIDGKESCTPSLNMHMQVCCCTTAQHSAYSGGGLVQHAAAASLLVSEVPSNVTNLSTLQKIARLSRMCRASRNVVPLRLYRAAKESKQPRQRMCDSNQSCAIRHCIQCGTWLPQARAHHRLVVGREHSLDSDSR
jgi:hypothetical protein